MTKFSPEFYPIFFNPKAATFLVTHLDPVYFTAQDVLGSSG